MIQSLIPKALSIFLKHRVPALLMGEQACILYGAAEFSRDIDFAVMASSSSLKKLKAALNDMEAKRIFVPALIEDVLLKGHACHFRCQKKEVENLRIDIMGKMRGVDSFDKLWQRRAEIELPGIGKIAVLALEDLVAAKKTQRDKDWYMTRRLIEADIYKATDVPPREKISFWLTECRTPELLISLAAKYPEITSLLAQKRPLLKSALEGNSEKVNSLIKKEEDKEKKLDRQYWRPLKAELEKWRHEARGNG